jgi:hypothetical protein
LLSELAIDPSPDFEFLIDLHRYRKELIGSAPKDSGVWLMPASPLQRALF